MASAIISATSSVVPVAEKYATNVFVSFIPFPVFIPSLFCAKAVRHVARAVVISVMIFFIVIKFCQCSVPFCRCKINRYLGCAAYQFSVNNNTFYGNLVILRSLQGGLAAILCFVYSKEVL